MRPVRRADNPIEMIHWQLCYGVRGRELDSAASAAGSAVMAVEQTFDEKAKHK